jgi:glycosyltransferase involved in cell wall biosynthesis
MMKARGHQVLHYGHADSEVDADEKIVVTDNDVLKRAYGDYDWKKNHFKHQVGDLANSEFNRRAIEEVGKRKQPGDILLLFWGIGHEEIAKAHSDMIAVEPGIGCFNRPCTPYSIFSSYSVMNFLYGQEKIQPRWSDAVIPHYFDLVDFTYRAQPAPEKYFVLLGRMIKSKGLEIAINIAKETGIKLKIAGQGDLKAELGYDPPADLVEVVGYKEPAERNELLGGAVALLMPTQYNEPFGCSSIEAMLCGTPIITSDWGAFAENNLHGVTGYRCRSMEQYVWAAKNVGEKIKRSACRAWAEKNFSMEAVAPMYEEYFEMIRAPGGFGALTKEGGAPRASLDWLRRDYLCSE